MSVVEKLPVIAIFDIGKTNKKLFLWDKNYQIVLEKSQNFAEIPDEDGFMGEDLAAVQSWVLASFADVQQDSRFEILALNFSGYGATVVFVNAEGKAVLPLYNYLKPFPVDLAASFYARYGGESEVARATASPILGSLNSGMMAYWMAKATKNQDMGIRWVLHWPNYLSSLFTHQFYTELTSVGCHTHLWDFDHQRYHEWVEKEGLRPLLPVTVLANQTFSMSSSDLPVGVGLHDSSSALIPYLIQFKEPFLLLSTGTWCISMHPFNAQPLTPVELKNDVLSFLQYNGKPVKAARLFAGNEHEIQLKRLQAHFDVDKKAHLTVPYSTHLNALLSHQIAHHMPSLQEANAAFLANSGFDARDLGIFESFEQAYQQFMVDLVVQQIYSLRLLLDSSPVDRILVDGGFSKNDIYMHLLAYAFPKVAIFGAEVAQASSLGAALAIHSTWNDQEIPINLVSLKRYEACE
ncbi:carbohydrate kinase [Cytophagaceae bacterium 50C-KIRBA]|uniref:Carbohydrate kinase n=1 Tax=Aquirufa beregesia TaxID=2516556 RepID=A0ABX0EWW9_9BACT|nr:FGGY-family carbohydrate kinase [Aquirufa beregesia]NGZ45070.1 carbohydrate kinase [Aquirufa beregesia]